MSIPIRKDITLIEFKGKLLNNINETLLSESLHVFENQYEVADLLSDIIVECIMSNKNTATINVSRYNLPFTQVTININKNSLIAKPSATLNTVDENGNLIVVLNICNQITAYYTKKELYLELKNIIAHELEHSYTILKTYNNTGNVDNTSTNTLYRTVYDIVVNPTSYNDVYYIAYAIYSTFGHELNAFVSQCYGEVYNYLSKLDTLSNKSIIEALKNSEVYKIFNTNIQNITQVLNYSDDNKRKFIDRFNSISKKDKINSIEQLNKLLNNTLKRNNESIKMCDRTAMNAFYKLT